MPCDVVITVPVYLKSLTHVEKSAKVLGLEYEKTGARIHLKLGGRTVTLYEKEGEVVTDDGITTADRQKLRQGYNVAEVQEELEAEGWTMKESTFTSVGAIELVMTR